MYQQRLNSQDIINIQQEELNTQKIKELENNLKMESMYSMMEGQEKERERIAKDLHDSLGGLLSTVKLQFESLNIKNESNIKTFDNANHLLDQACQEVREISRNLQPSALINLGLVPAVNDLINRFNDSAYPGIDFQHYNMEDIKLENSIALNVYRVIQELIYNAIKHAKAKEILVQITHQQDELIVMVEDDGVGFKPGQVKKGMGTENISSRVNFLNGELSVHSSQNKGTNVLINIPLSKA
jgi:signal transduction histidine kinase